MRRFQRPPSLGGKRDFLPGVGRPAPVQRSKAAGKGLFRPDLWANRRAQLAGVAVLAGGDELRRAVSADNGRPPVGYGGTKEPGFAAGLVLDVLRLRSARARWGGDSGHVSREIGRRCRLLAGDGH